jgi:hypothetical protein
MKLLNQIKTALAVPGRFIATCDTLAEAVREQTEAIRVLTRTNAIQHLELLAAVAPIEKHVKYVATAERHTLQRAGHKHDF